MCQLYYTDPRLHYEVWNLGERRNRLEIGLHFESRDRALNAALLRGFSARMVAVKAALGPQWEAEHWDKAGRRCMRLCRTNRSAPKCWTPSPGGWRGR